MGGGVGGATEGGSPSAGSSGADCVGKGAEASGASALKPHASMANDKIVHAVRRWKMLREEKSFLITKQVSVESEAMMGMAVASLRG